MDQEEFVKMQNMKWSEKIEYLISQYLRTSSDDDTLNGFYKCKFISADDEKKEFVVEYKIERWMENPRGELHGGACSTIFDIATGLASTSVASNGHLATLDLYVNYLSRAKGTDTLIVTTKIVRSGRQFIRLASEAMSKEKGKLIATCIANYATIQGQDTKPLLQPETEVL